MLWDMIHAPINPWILKKYILPKRRKLYTSEAVSRVMRFETLITSLWKPERLAPNFPLIWLLNRITGEKYGHKTQDIWPATGWCKKFHFVLHETLLVCFFFVQCYQICRWIMVPCVGTPTTRDLINYFTVSCKTDINTWHIVDKQSKEIAQYPKIANLAWQRS
jgi:hypothetical protein